MEKQMSSPDGCFQKDDSIEVPMAVPVQSQLLTDMLVAAHFIVRLREAKEGTIDNETIKDELQKMVNNHTIDCMFATVSFVMTLIEKGVIAKPVADFAAKFMDKRKDH